MHTRTQSPARAQVQQALCALLAQGDDVERSHVCRALGSVGDAQAVTALIERLHDADPDVRSDAAGALGRLGDAAGDAAAVAALIESLRQDPDDEVKIAAVEALGRIGGSEASAVLSDIAARRPDDFGFVADVWDPWWDMQLKAVEALGRLRVAAAVPVLTGLLDDEDGQDIESELLTALARLGEAGEAVLIARLTNRGSTRQRRRAAHALRLGTTPTAVSAVGRALMDPAPEVRGAAALALAEAGAVRYLPAILLLFRDRDAEVRGAAVRAADRLGAMTGDTALPVPELARLIRDTDPRVRSIALNTLSRCVPDLDEPTVEAVRAGALDDPETEAAAAACRVLGRLQDAAGVAVLIRVIADETRTVQVRCAAATALGQAGQWNEPVAATLGAACMAAQAPLRLAALDALMTLETVSLELHREAIDDADPAVPAPLADAAQPVLNLLRGATADDPAADTGQAKGTASSAADVPASGPLDAENDAAYLSAENAPPVTSTLDAIARTNRAVALALDEDAAPDVTPDATPDAALEPYLDIVKNNDAVGRWLLTRPGAADIATDARRLACRVLGRSRHPDTVPALIETLGSADAVIRSDAARSLAAIAHRAPETPGLNQAVAALIQGLASSEREERAACAEALGVVARVSRPLPTAAADPLAVAGRTRSSRLDVGLATPSPSSAACAPPQQRLDALATDGGEKRGLGGRGALAALLIALGDADAAVRDQAIRALVGLAADTRGVVSVPPAELEIIVTHLLRHLEDGEAPLRATAARQLAALVQPLRAAGWTERVQQLIEAIVMAGLAGDGGQARAMGQALRHSGVDTVSGVLLPLLGTLGNGRQRRALLEMLEEACAAEELPPA